MLEGRKLALAHIAAHALTLFFLLVYFWILIITAIDNALFYAVFPYRYFIAVSLILLLVLVPGRNWRFKLGLFLILAVWFSLLPRVSWHEETRFFINAGSLREGMAVEEAAARMKPYVMTVSADGREVWFQPWPGARESAVATVRKGKLREVMLRPE